MTARERAGAVEDAERWLLDRELFGMRFGLDRMRRLLTVLGSPQDAFRAVHVVGTNGKSSTVRMTAAILEAHGLRTGAYLSPHLVSFRERIRIGDADLAPEDFADAIARVRRAAEKVDRGLVGGDRVTQFEALTAAAYSELARQGVEVAVVEAGLGGRWDATNVIASEVAVLTNVGLEHTRWLGPTVRDIAREKLAVVRPGSALVLGADLHPDAFLEAHAAGAGRLVVAADSDPALEIGARGTFQRRNFAAARAAAEALIGPLDDDFVRQAAAAVRVPGRFEVVDEEPLTILDGAHNPGGMRALADSLSDVHRPLVTVLSVLDDKDATSMLRALLPHADAVVCTSNANPRALSPATLASLTAQLGGACSEMDPIVEPDPHRALALAQDLAGPEGAVLATGSIYLIADLARPRGATEPRSTL
ncbi:MAG TPA: folylpolyglutamate synthase/dihydrofolate synthase family protein [Solirubrobacteraceae bacterium]|nr:folylpolyglutamate synthase/dihydrofolate synthase family protein [Solirubrobacteraceae bacterium]